MVSKKTKILNSAGIHVRPSSEIFKYIGSYEGEVFIIAKGQELKIKSMFEILMLALLEGDEVTIKVQGPNEEQTCSDLVDLFSKHYDFK